MTCVFSQSMSSVIGPTAVILSERKIETKDRKGRSLHSLMTQPDWTSLADWFLSKEKKKGEEDGFILYSLNMEEVSSCVFLSIIGDKSSLTSHAN